MNTGVIGSFSGILAGVSSQLQFTTQGRIHVTAPVVDNLLVGFIFIDLSHAIITLISDLNCKKRDDVTHLMRGLGNWEIGCKAAASWIGNTTLSTNHITDAISHSAFLQQKSTFFA